MPSNFKAADPYVNEQVDLDDVFITDAWLVDQFVGSQLWGCGYGGLGILPSNYSSPIQIGSLTNWKQVTVSSGTAYAVKTDGTLWAWGSGSGGAIGNGTGSNYVSPIQIGSLTNWTSVTAGRNAGGAIKTDGTLWAWGLNTSGQLGNGTVTNYSSPIQIGSLTNWKQVSMSYSFLTSAIKNDGTLWTWGTNDFGELGNGTRVKYSSPIQIGSLTNWKQVSSGGSANAGHALAIKTDGTLWAWGWNSLGRLGNETIISYSSPIQIGSLTNWKQVACGYDHTVSIKTDGTLWAWGGNAQGQLGNGTNTNYVSPIQIGSLANWKQVACGYGHTAAIKTDGTLWTWGKNHFGQLSNSNRVYYSSPIQVGSLSNWKQVGLSSSAISTIVLTYQDI